MSYLSTVLSIVPRLPPSIDGVGDYAMSLARQLRKDFNIQTHFIVGNPTWMGSLEIEGFPISQITDSSVNKLVELLSELYSPVLLHYVGYGYAKRGCPVWLVDGLQHWKSLYPQRSLITMFHELYASGLPWQSSFWLSHLQKKLVARLARLSSHVTTSNQSYADILDSLALAAHSNFDRFQVTSVPVFSNIGEPRNLLPLSERHRQLVVFGHKNSRTQVYKIATSSLQQICESLEIEQIVDIGNPTGLDLTKEISNIINVSIAEKGIIEALEISKILSNSIAGFLNFPPPAYLAKSTIFAAYCAHAVIPCMAMGSEQSINNLIMNEHYFSTDNQGINLSLRTGQNISNQAYAWYQSHSLSEQAKLFYKFLKN